jgi:hypothetical protein
MGSGPADVVPVRLDPELREAVESRATEDKTTTSDVIRRALKDFLHVRSVATLRQARVLQKNCPTVTQMLQFATSGAGRSPTLSCLTSLGRTAGVRLKDGGTRFIPTVLVG